ncbi:MAG: CCA tRNA nucleotidyltransferase [Candidatus Limnocylindrales bacterium]
MPEPASSLPVPAARGARAGGRMPDAEVIAALVPPAIRGLLERLWAEGHAAYVVGGSLRDALLSGTPSDWDVTTDARPARIQSLFPGSRYENRFGTVLVPTGAGEVIEITTFRSDHRYGDHRRPDKVTFGDYLLDDLSRRDFTVNALAWGRPKPRQPAHGARAVTRPSATEPVSSAASPTAQASLVDAFGGVDDLRRGVLRAVGDPLRRFDEDALRLVRAARLAAQLGFEIEERTLDAMCVTAELVRYVSRERLGGELRKLLRSREPSRGLRIMADTGILAAAIPELAEQRGVAQNKVPGMDCWEHTLATVDAARQLSHGDEILPLAALFHDAGKPRTLSDGHFFGHELVGAQIAEEVLRGMAVPREEIDAVAHLVRHHMFNYELTWSDAAVRRLVQRVGPDAVDDLLGLREADNLGSGQGADQGHLLDLRRRITEQRERGFATSIADLAVNGHDLQRELGLQPGPVVGELLSRLLESAIADPARNTYRQSILDARGWLPELLEQAATRKASPAGGADGT